MNDAAAPAPGLGAILALLIVIAISVWLVGTARDQEGAVS